MSSRVRFARIWFHDAAYLYLKSLPDWKRQQVVGAIDDKVRSGELPLIQREDGLWTAQGVAGFAIECAVDERDPARRELGVLRLEWLGDLPTKPSRR